MFRTLWGLFVLFNVCWLGYVFFKKALALTNTNIFSLLGWAWSDHPKGVMYSLLFYFLFCITAVLMVSTLQKLRHVVTGEPRVMVYVGDELLNREQRFYDAGDPEKKIVKASTGVGNRLKFSYPTALDHLFTRQLMWISGAEGHQPVVTADASPSSSWVTSFFFYVFLGFCIAILHVVARDYMALEGRLVTPMDSVGEFIIVIPLLLLINGVLLVAHHWVYNIKAGRVDPVLLQPVAHYPVTPGEVIHCRLLDHARVANMGKGSGLVGDQAAYYLFGLKSPEGVEVTAAIQFGFSGKRQSDIEAFTASIQGKSDVPCRVTEHMTLRPVGLQNMALNWFPSS